jgi:hypothetical protein
MLATLPTSSAFAGRACVQARRARCARSAAALRTRAMAAQTVLVTGAGGRTGRLVFEKLQARPELFTARGLVRRACG